MGFRFRKSFKIIKGVRANVSTSGVSFTIGGKGASINTGKNGTYVNLGLPGTGISYRKKIGSTSTAKKTAKSISNSEEKKNIEAVTQYENSYDQLLNIHKYTANVESYEAFEKHLDTLTNEGSKNALMGLMSGNQDFIDIAIDNRIESLQLPYDCNICYQLDGSIIMLDVDLPEITDMPTEYPTLLKSGTILTKKYSTTTIKQNYAQAVISLSIYLAANIFNITPYIRTAIISGYTQTRDTVGDLKDQYIYSFDFSRELFEQTDLQQIGKAYDFVLQSNNRINLSTSFTFKTIVPFIPFREEETTEQADKQPEDPTATAVEALKTLGYKASEINAILPDLKALPFISDEDCLKQALTLIKAQKKL